MNEKRNIRRMTACAKLLLVLSFTGFTKVGAQVNQPVDTNIIVAVNYPLLTQKEGAGLKLPVPPQAHPRLYLTAKDIPVLQQKLTAPVLKECTEKIMLAADISTDSLLKRSTIAQNFNTQIRNAIEAKALWYVLKNNKAYGQEAVAALLRMYAIIKFDSTKQDICREIGRTIVTGAIVYDWCYPLLSAPQKQLLIGHMETLATQLEVKWPYLVQGSVTGHGTEAQLSRDMLSFGIAVYNEKPGIYNRVAGRILAEFTPVRQHFYPASYHHQGSVYGPYRLYWDVWATLLFDKIGYPNIFGKDQLKAYDYFLYSRRPDGQLFRNGDDFNELFNPFGKYWNIGGNVAGFLGSYNKSPLLMGESVKETKPGSGADYLFDLFFYDPSITPVATKASLPLTKYFKEPLGAMIARTGWDEGLSASTAIAEMKIGVYNYVNHQHLDAGSFQLYYKGPLAVQSGVYQGVTGGYGSEHFLNYSQRTIAHNTMLVYDPAQQFRFGKKGIGNDGGQPYPANGAEAQTEEEIVNNGYKTGTVLAHAFGQDSMMPEYSYLKGELAEAYGPKVKSFRRSFVFLNLENKTVPAALIVYDNVMAADKNFKKTWLLHCVQEPMINGNRCTISRTEKGYGGQLVNTTLLPEKENLAVTKIGGAGNEYTVGGKNFPQAPANKEVAIDSAMWRIEVSPKNASANDVFLNVMQVTDAGTDSSHLLKIEKIETPELTGVTIGDRIVLFSKSGELLSSSYNFSVSGTGSHKVLIADVQAGKWKVENKGGTSFTGMADISSQCLYFTLVAGTYHLLKTK